MDTAERLLRETIEARTPGTKIYKYLSSIESKESAVPAKATFEELEWLVAAPKNFLRVEMLPNGEVRAYLNERGRAFLPNEQEGVFEPAERQKPRSRENKESPPAPTVQSELPDVDELAHKLWGTWPKPGEIEAFDLARSLERRLLEALAKQDAMQRRAESAEADWQAAEHRLAERGREGK